MPNHYPELEILNLPLFFKIYLQLVNLQKAQLKWGNVYTTLVHSFKKFKFNDPGIHILQKIRNYANLKIQNGKSLPKLNIGIYSEFGQYYRYDITMYDFIHIIQFLIPIWSWISKIMLENETFFHFFSFLSGF